jgi:predicted GNAT family N-acyltransferase
MEEFLTQVLNKSHIKENFNCGFVLLDNYLKRQAKQDVNRDLSVCYVLSDEITNTVISYYTLSSDSIKRSVFPENLTKKLPVSYDLPVVLLGRLAVDISNQGNNYGKLLLIDALKRCFLVSQTIGLLAVVVDPIDENATKFYKKFGFELLSNNRMFIPMKTVRDLFLE